MQRPSLKRDRTALDDVSGGSLGTIVNVGKRPTSPSKSSITPSAKRGLPILEGVLSPVKPQFAHALYTLMERRPSASPVRQNLFQSLAAAAISTSELPSPHASPLRKRPRIERGSSPTPEPFQTPRKARRRDTTSRVPALREREIYECLERAPLPAMTPSVRWFSESPATTPVPQTPAAFLVEPEVDDSEDDTDPGFTIWSDHSQEDPAGLPPKPQVVLDDEDAYEEDKENQKPAFPKAEDDTRNTRPTAFSTLSSPDRRRKLPLRPQGPLLPLAPTSAAPDSTPTTRRNRPAPTGRALLQWEVDGDAEPYMPMLSMT